MKIIRNVTVKNMIQPRKITNSCCCYVRIQDTPATEAYKLIYAKREVVQIGNLEESLPSRLADPLAPTFPASKR